MDYDQLKQAKSHEISNRWVLVFLSVLERIKLEGKCIAYCYILLQVNPLCAQLAVNIQFC